MPAERAESAPVADQQRKRVRSKRRSAHASARGAGGRAGAGDVRPHRGRLRPDEHGDDGRPAPPLARARRRARARVGPGSRVLDVATGTGDLALELARAWRRAARWSAATSPRRCSRARARRPSARPRGVQPRFEWGDALQLPYADDSFDAATVGFGARNFSDLGARSGRDGARRAPRRPGGGARDHDAHAAAAVALLPLWFDRLVPALGRLTGAIAALVARATGLGRRRDDRRRLHLPAQLGQALSRRRPRWPPRWSARGWATSATC